MLGDRLSVNLVRLGDTWLNPDKVYYLKRRPDDSTAIFFTPPHTDTPLWLVVPECPGEVAALLTGDDHFYRSAGM